MQHARLARRGAAAGAALAAAAAIALSLSPVAAASRARSAAVPACTTAGLVVWMNTNGGGAAGSVYYTLEFTNLSGHSCSLRGYPGVSAVSLSGSRIGSPGGRDPFAAPHTVVLGASGPHQTATATLRIVEAGNFPSGACGITTAAGIRVYPPNQTASKIVPFPFSACSRSGPQILKVRVVQ
jgi:hypothetical protein